MKAVGAGTVLAALGGTAVVGGRDDTAGGRAADGDVLQQEAAVHTVQTVISAPSTNPERPADFYYQPTGLAVQPGDVLRFEFVTPDHNVVSYHPAFGMRRRVPLGVTAVSSPLLGFRPESIPGDMVDPPAPVGGEEPTGTATGTPTETAVPDGNVGETAIATATATEGAGTPDGDAGGPVPDHWLLALDEPGVYDFLCSPHEHFGMAMRVVVGDETETPFETEDPEALPEPRVGPVGLARVTLTDSALAPENIVDQGTVQWSALESVQDDGDEGTATATAEAETEAPGGNVGETAVDTETDG